MAPPRAEVMVAQEPVEEAAEPAPEPPADVPDDPSICVEVVDEAGSPLPGARLTLYPFVPHDRGSRSFGSIYHPVAVVDPMDRAACGGDGVGWFGGLATDAYRVEARAPGHVPCDARIVCVEGTPYRAMRLVLPPGHAFHGRLASATGEPRAARDVVLATRGDSYGPSPTIGHFRSTSDVEGVFRMDGLPRGVYDVWVDDPANGFVLLGAARVPGAAGAAFVLPEAGTFRGRVTEKGTGQPFPGARVEVATNGFFGRSTELVATTGEDGTFSVVAEEGRSLEREGEVQVSAPGCKPVRAPFDRLPFAGELIEMDFELEAAMAFAGVVRDARGPVGGATVHLYSPGADFLDPVLRREVRTDRRGEFRIDGLPARPFGVWVEAREHRDAEWGDRAATLGEGAAPSLHDTPPTRRFDGELRQTVEAELRIERITSDEKIEPSVERTIAGRVLRPDGSPAPYVRVHTSGAVAKIWIHESGLTFTAPDGSYSITSRSVPDSFAIYAMSDEGWFAEHRFDTGLHEDRLDFEMRLEKPEDAPRELSGTVRRPDGTPAAGAHVYVALHMGQYRGGSFPAWDQFPVVLCDEDGAFRFPPTFREPSFHSSKMPYPVAEIVLIAELPGHAPAVSNVIPIDKEDTLPATVGLDLPAGHAVAGRVVDSEGRPVPGVAVTFGESTGWFSRGDWPPVLPPSAREAVVTITDGDGRFEIPNVPPEVYEVSVAPPGWTSARAERTVPGHTPVELVIHRTRTVRGRVVDPAGQPVAGASISQWWDEDSSFRDLTTNRDGTFALVAVACEPFELRASPPEGRTDVAAALLAVDAAATSVQLTLPAPGEVSGHVDDGEEGRDLEDAVTATSVDHGDRITASAGTDAEGRFRLTGLPPGRYDVTYRRDGVERTIGPVDLGTRDVRFGPSGKATVRGSARFGDGTNAGARISLRRLAPAGGVVERVEGWGYTDEDGTYAVALLSPGTYELEAVATRYAGEDGTGERTQWRCRKTVDVPEEGLELDLVLDEQVPEDED